MKKVLALTVVLSAAACPALAQSTSNISDVYVVGRGGGGLMFFDGLNVDNPRATATVHETDNRGAGFASVGLGTRIANSPFRLEIEGVWSPQTHEAVNTVGACSAAQCGTIVNFNGYNRINVDTRSLLVNVYYDWKVGGPFVVFGGAGIGASFLRTSASQRYTSPQFPAAGLIDGASWPGRTTTNLAWALTTGLAVDVSQRVKLELGLRYTDNGRYRTGLDTNLFQDERFSARVSTLSAFAGVRIGF